MNFKALRPNTYSCFIFHWNVYLCFGIIVNIASDTTCYCRVYTYIFQIKKKLLFNREYKKIHTFNFFACYVILFSKKTREIIFWHFHGFIWVLEASAWLCVLNQSTRIEISKIKKKFRQKAKKIQMIWRVFFWKLPHILLLEKGWSIFLLSFHSLSLYLWFL